MRKLLIYAAALSLPAIAACTVHQADVPSVSGPSSLAISLNVAASPDTLPQDGAAQSQIVVKALNAGGQPYPNLAIRLDMTVNHAVKDFGTLSVRTLVTVADGTAKSVYTAPAGPSAGGIGTSVTLVATPIASDAAATGVLNSVGGVFQAIIRLTPAGDIVPPVTEQPTANFTVTPASPTAGQLAVLNGTGSCAGTTSGNACAATQRTITGYVWDFGDGTTGTGSVVSHTWPNATVYVVKLTVTNDTNSTNFAIGTVTVGAPAATNPTAAFTALPNPARSGQDVQLNGSPSSTSTDGVAIVNYLWNFGDGTTVAGSSSPTTSHQYTVVTTTAFSIQLTVMDAKGRTNTVSHSITINP